MAQRWLARHSGGELFELCTETNDDEEAFRLFGERVLSMAGDFDTANVDCDLWPLDRALRPGEVRRLEDELP
jgi:hypothetical protein